jgi:hypothetical protein
LVEPVKPLPFNDGVKTWEQLGAIAKLLSPDDKTLFREVLKEYGFDEDQLIKSFSNTRGYQAYLKPFLPLIFETGYFKKYDMIGYSAQILEELISRDNLDKELLEHFYKTLTYDEKKFISEKTHKIIQDITKERKHVNNGVLRNKLIILSKYVMLC